MQSFLNSFNASIASITAVLWHPVVLYFLLAVGILLTLWSRFGQWRSLTHGVAAVRGDFDDPEDPGAISHFQALSAALSATVGLGNIGGVALAVALGGPGAVFWMWVVGLLGMALKTTEVTLSMLYRNTDDPKNPHGGPMWVVSRGLAARSPKLAGVGKAAGGFFCVTLLVSALTGGNLFQAWNVGNITQQYFGIPSPVVGMVLAALVGAVILGGIRRIGVVAGRLVPFMCGAYLVAGLYVIALHIDQIPAIFVLIFESAFRGGEAQGAFVGGTVGFAFATGMQRAFFSNEAGQGSSPIAHAAARTDEPAREGLVAGLEPFIDTLVVCTLTALVIFASGAWNRGADLAFVEAPRLVQLEGETWTLEGGLLPSHPERPWQNGDTVQTHLRVGEQVVSLTGTVALAAQAGAATTAADLPELGWAQLTAVSRPSLEPGVYLGYTSAAFTAHAFDRVQPGLGKWLVTLATWLFALSTIISWSYYGEQGVVFLAGEGWVKRYRLMYCAFVVIACSGLVRTTAELNSLTMLGTGCMLWANVPITLLFARQAMECQHDYAERCAAGEEGVGSVVATLESP